MIEINLLSTDSRPRPASITKKQPALAPVPRIFPISLGGLTLLMALLIVVSGSRVGASQRRSRRVEDDLRTAKAQAAEAERISQDFPALAGRYTTLTPRLDGRIPWAEVLRVVSLWCPDGVLITALELEHDRRTGQPTKLVIRGLYSDSGSLEMRFASALKESATFTQLFEAVIPEKDLIADDRTSFAISCLLRPFQDELVDGNDEAPNREAPNREASNREAPTP